MEKRNRARYALRIVSRSAITYFFNKEGMVYDSAFHELPLHGVCVRLFRTPQLASAWFSKTRQIQPGGPGYPLFLERYSDKCVRIAITRTEMCETELAMSQEEFEIRKYESHKVP